jgi:CO/xanthine dehydrogenase FAD-binding subunit
MDVFQPTSLEEALEVRGRSSPVAVAGGTDLMVALNARSARPSALLDLSRIDRLRGLRQDTGRTVVGALTTFSDLVNTPGCPPVLAAASRTVGSPQIRNRGTVGGNLATGSPAGDALPPLIALGAEVSVRSAARGTRIIPVHTFLLGPKRTALADDELIVEVSWPPADGPQLFSKVGPRNAMVIAVASVALVLDPQSRSCRLALGAVAPTVVRAAAAEVLLTDALAEAGAWEHPAAEVSDDVVAAVGRLAATAAEPIDDHRGTAGYRRHAVDVLSRRVASWALDDLRALVGGA